MLIDYVGFTVSQQRMREQFDFEAEPAAPRPSRRTVRLNLDPLRLIVATLLRQAADHLEPARPTTLAIDCCDL